MSADSKAALMVAMKVVPLAAEKVVELVVDWAVR